MILKPKPYQVLTHIFKYQKDHNVAIPHKVLSANTGIGLSNVGNIVSKLIRDGVICRASRCQYDMYELLVPMPGVAKEMPSLEEILKRLERIESVIK